MNETRHHKYFIEFIIKTGNFFPLTHSYQAELFVNKIKIELIAKPNLAARAKIFRTN